ncbi:penicillin-binding protein 1C [Maribacter sp. 2-571]|uniref:penicillin-binding protein 1C n=1 Tax=Maribacter sp. 2-571 TaxID=3417569 RepID=UPI003D330580
MQYKTSDKGSPNGKDRSGPLDRGKRFFQKHPKKLLFLFLLLAVYHQSLPKVLFDAPTATVVQSSTGTLLGAKIADDGQWRFPEVDSVPQKFKTCLLAFEDAYFYRHPGFNPVAMVKALGANVSAGKTVRGGSTITQQLIRLSRSGRSRSYWEKAIELVLATRLEFRQSKREILRLYASHAPYGGNVVGLDVAAWRYFGLRPHQLSWAESATLAVLPNAPSLIYPGKNQQLLLKKRNRLLKKLWQGNTIDSTTYELAKLEPLPQKPYPLPTMAKHLVQYTDKKYKGQRITTTLNETLQLQTNTIVAKHYGQLKQNQVHNAAVLVMEVDTRKVLAYIGNSPTTNDHQKDVDMVQANRSTGSVIKPLLYAAMLDAGELLPEMLVPDVPTQIAGYTPENFDDAYSGAVTAKKALARSLNIPAVRLLQRYGLQKFRDQLHLFQLKGIDKSADHYGLTLILGGAESNLWDLCKTYANLAATVNEFNRSSSEYYSNAFVDPVLTHGKLPDQGTLVQEETLFDAGSIYLTFEAMKEVNRPEGSESWEFYDSSKQIAWKTGTSFGNKDAWAIGVSKKYVVGVWVGNADGEGRPEVTGVSSAAPVLFDVFDILPTSTWFSEPLDAFTDIGVCTKSGYLATGECPTTVRRIPNKKNYVKACPYHHTIQLNAAQQFRVNSSCADLSQTVSRSWFVLPTLMEYYYKRSHPEYRVLPPFLQGCEQNTAPPMEFIYPKMGSRIGLVKNFEGKTNEVIFKLAHSKPETQVYWYLNDDFMGQTVTFHEMGMVPPPGKHKITVIDALGNEVFVTITIE